MQYFVIGLLIWLILFVAGNQQYKRLRQKTIDLTLFEIQAAKKNNKELSVEQYYQILLPHWEEMVSHSAWFILHKTELFPMPATPKYIKKRMNFTPAWLGAFLQINGIKLTCEKDLEEEINTILEKAPERQKKITRNHN